MTICHSEEERMKRILEIIVAMLLIGGMILTAASCEGCWFPGMIGGSAIMILAALIANYCNKKERS
jgi:hypothetical protein